jgi:mannose-1-phosphate guanylyltransferase
MPDGRTERDTKRMFGVVMAGGGGTRLWPKSRERYPKQMHALVTEKPLVQDTTERLQRILGEDRVYIVTNAHHAKVIESTMPFMAGKMIIDPYRRDTAPCIGLAAVYLSKIDPDAVMGVFPSDPYIGIEDSFAQVVKVGGKLAAAGHVVTVGILPTGPETGYGYIEMGDAVEAADGVPVHRVRRFVEKPSKEKAEEYVAAGRYLWNSGMFMWSIPTVLSLFEKHMPDTFARLMRIREAIGTPNEAAVVDREYREMDKISIDYGIMEKLDDILVVPGAFDWNDIGNWATVCDITPKDTDGNVVQAHRHIGIDTTDSLIVGTGGRVVATIGVNDLIIIDTEDAILICRKDRAQDVKKIVDKLKERDLHEYL